MVPGQWLRNLKLVWTFVSPVLLISPCTGRTYSDVSHIILLILIDAKSCHSRHRHFAALPDNIVLVNAS